MLEKRSSRPHGLCAELGGCGPIVCQHMTDTQFMEEHMKMPRVKKHHSPEFHAGPKGKSTAKTWRMMGDWAASSSSLSALSCTTGAHCSISVD